MIKSGGRGFNSHPDQSLPLSLCGPNSISRVNAHMVYGQKISSSHYTLFVPNIRATRPTFVINGTLPCTSDNDVGFYHYC